jgi:hypothetical protein
MFIHETPERDASHALTGAEAEEIAIALGEWLEHLGYWTHDVQRIADHMSKLYG